MGENESKPKRVTGKAFCNLVLGTLYFSGSLLGGYLANYWVGFVGVALGLQLVYSLSAGGRAIGALSFMILKEPFKYPSTLRKELRSIVDKLPLMPERSPSRNDKFKRKDSVIPFLEGCKFE